jgi:hypothetical protein
MHMSADLNFTAVLSDLFCLRKGFTSFVPPKVTLFGLLEFL